MNGIERTTNVADPWGYGRDLAAALRQAELAEFERSGEPSPAARAAAVRVAVALGRCRLGEVPLCDESDGRLSAAWAAAAAERLAARLREAAAEAEQLAERYDAAETQGERDRLGGGLLALRMDAWAALLALQEVCSACLSEDQPGGDALEQALDQLVETLAQFDEALQDQQELLSSVAATPRLDNWRAALGPLHRAAPPWWLDGRLERTAARLQDEAAATLPSAGAWRALHSERQMDLTSTARPDAERSVALAAGRPNLDGRPVRVELPPPVAYALAGAAEGSPPRNRRLRWSPPTTDAGDLAQMLVPVVPPPTAAQSVRLSFFRSGQRAEAWVGQPIELSGIRRTVDQRAGVTLTYDEVYRACGSPEGLVLRVGEERISWELETE
ncbi:MAG TPA: hypothetical protein PLF81_20080 [Candidatus Anammoximicrobium sp.]|nr:hypothetical protein [Candidatus Anammoximicrobium sp.]